MESSSDFGTRAPNWEMQKISEAQWLAPMVEDLLLAKEGRVLDLGHGYGTLAAAAYLLGHAVTAVDLVVPARAFLQIPQQPGIWK